MGIQETACTYLPRQSVRRTEVSAHLNGPQHLCKITRLSTDCGILNPWRTRLTKDDKVFDKVFVVTRLQSIWWGDERVAWTTNTEKLNKCLDKKNVD